MESSNPLSRSITLKVSDVVRLEDTNWRRVLVRDTERGELNERSKKFRQIFLITHIEKAKSYIRYVLTVTGDEEGASWMRTEE
jgi:hypothetical protein